MGRPTNLKIYKSHVVLCEVRDAQEFMISFLSHVSSDKSDF